MSNNCKIKTGSYWENETKDIDIRDLLTKNNKQKHLQR